MSDELRAVLPEVFDHSFTGAYGECQRMAYYERILGRHGRETDFTLVWGSVFHKVAEVWADTQDINRVIEVISTNIPEETDDRYGRTQRRMQELFLEWVKFRKTDPIEILHTEQAVTVICDKPCMYFPDSPNGCNLTYGGRMDAIVRWNALVGPLDYKTTVMDTDDPVQEYKPHHQMPGYIWLGSHLLGRHLWGVIVEKLLCNKSKLFVRRFPVPYPKDLIVEWVENERAVHAEIREKFAAHANDELFWRQNYGRCYLPYRCKYRDVCLSPRDMNFRMKWLRDNTIESRFDFRERTEEDAK